MEDDGSLAFLNIPHDPNSRHFNCDAITQSRLINLQFVVLDFLEDVPTKFSKEKGKSGQTLVKIKIDNAEKKFFTGSSEILYVLRRIKEMGAFPRRVTLRCSGNRFYFE